MFIFDVSSDALKAGLPPEQISMGASEPILWPLASTEMDKADQPGLQSPQLPQPFPLKQLCYSGALGVPAPRAVWGLVCVMGRE